MRYLIETKDENAKSWGTTLYNAQQRGEIKIIEKGDPVEKIKTEMLRMKRAIETLEKAGINKDVMIAYINQKGVTMKAIESVLKYQKEFLEKLGAL